MFTATADCPCSAAPAHLAEIAFRPLAVIEQDMAAHPDDYTETLRHVLAFWREAAPPAARCAENLHAEPVSAT